ncbi:hypothetical protein CTH30272_02093 [Allocatenococcus thiocycli]|nr:hypothetical protein CTH30272_02093 [Catenococcus thiocycli]
MGERLTNWRFILIWIVFLMFGLTGMMFGAAKLLAVIGW